MQATLNGWLGRLGWPGVVGVGLLVAIAGFYLSVLTPEREHLADLRHELADLRQQAAHPQEVPRSPTDLLGAFYENFPGSTRLPAVLGVIFEAAKNQQLELDEGEYRVATSRVGRLVQYQLTLPVHGTYPQIRRFVDEAMAKEPALSLQSIHFERQKIEDPTVQAKVKMVMFLGEAP
jgi:hypothetical protein